MSNWQVAIVGLPSFFSPGSNEQLIITLLITVFSLCIFVQINPYHTHSVSGLHSLCMLSFGRLLSSRAMAMQHSLLWTYWHSLSL